MDFSIAARLPYMIYGLCVAIFTLSPTQEYTRACIFGESIITNNIIII